MATLCRRIIQRKRVRVLEGRKLKEERLSTTCRRRVDLSTTRS